MLVPGLAEFIYIIGNSFEDENFDNYALCLQVDWCLLYGQLSNRQVASTRFWWIYLHRSISTKTIHVCQSIMASVDVKHHVDLLYLPFTMSCSVSLSVVAGMIIDCDQTTQAAFSVLTRLLSPNYTSVVELCS